MIYFYWLFYQVELFRIPWDFSLTPNVLKQNLFHSISIQDLTDHPVESLSQTCFYLFWSSGHQHESFLNRENPYDLKPLIRPITEIKNCYLYPRSHSHSITRGNPYGKQAYQKRAYPFPILLNRLYIIFL